MQTHSLPSLLVWGVFVEISCVLRWGFFGFEIITEMKFPVQ